MAGHPKLFVDDYSTTAPDIESGCLGQWVSADSCSPDDGGGGDDRTVVDLE